MDDRQVDATLLTILEQLAALEHERWSHWQRYLHSQCQRSADGSLIIPSRLAARWEKQSCTPYSELSEDEKESDREQVRRYLPIIAALLQGEASKQRE